MKFIADTMMGTLVKWLRILGYDTAYARDMDDSEIIAAAESEGRTILSRDRELCSRKADCVLMQPGSLESQISAVMKLCPPSKENILTRCLVCNTVLESIPRESASGKVPDDVLQRQAQFWKCQSCGRHYWAGTHWQAMMKRATELAEGFDIQRIS